MDLDFDLLDQVLDELQPIENNVSISVQHQVLRETNPEFINLISSVANQTDWHLIDSGMSLPLVCIECNSRICEHIVNDNFSFHLFEVWDTNQLAIYGQQVDQCNLDYGLLN